MDRRMKRKGENKMEHGIEMKKESIEEFAVYLRERENAKATIRKYLNP